MSSKYELSNLSGSETAIIGEDGKMGGKDGGCYVRTATGTCLVMYRYLLNMKIYLKYEQNYMKIFVR